MARRPELRLLGVVAIVAAIAAILAPPAAADGSGVTLHVSASPASGHPVTITPVMDSTVTIGPDDFCRWEFRWGSTASLDQGITDETFGGLLFDVAAAAGGCGPWTLTLPWVPYPQFDVWFDVVHRESDGGTVFTNHDDTRFVAALDSSDRRITSSTLPIAQVLPNTYSPVVGSPVTYTLYLLDGATACCAPRWVARLGNGENPRVWEKLGGSTCGCQPVRVLPPGASASES
jgi:hypothetical protein